jgi:hypothetical protein
MGVTEGAGPRRWPLLNLGRARGPIGSTSPGLSDKKISPGQQQCSARANSRICLRWRKGWPPVRRLATSRAVHRIRASRCNDGSFRLDTVQDV